MRNNVLTRAASSLGLTLALGVAIAASLVHCSAPAEDDAEGAVAGIHNKLGLALRFDEKTHQVQATLAQPLADDEQLWVRVRAGKMTLGAEKDLDCTALTPAKPIRSGGARELTGKVVYQGPKVDPAVFELAELYSDPRWATGAVPAATLAKGKLPDPIVEACVMKGSTVKAKLQVNLAYAWDVGTRDKALLKTLGEGVHPLDGPTGLDGGGGATAADAGAPGAARDLDESNVTSQIEYGQLCEAELGSIPFFPKIRDGEYETFDCRELLANGTNGKHALAGVEGARIPATIDGVETKECSPGRELGIDSSSYECLEKADHGMYLASGGTQPGPMVVTAKNERGTHWVLLCRKVADDGRGMLGTKKFNDVAMIGHNPKTGRTCFFQNSIGSGTDGEHVPHPGDVSKSTSLWSSYVQSYCSGQCHSNGPFVHSPWIDGAKRSNGKPIVPMLGTLPDLPISNPDSPYNIVAASKLGFTIPKVLVSEEASPCTNCHTLAAGNTLGNFTEWSTGTGDAYYAKITDYGKQFAHSHWMPLNLDGVTEESWATSKYGKALAFIKKCNATPGDPACEWADPPRGKYDNPPVR
jgi:hypothetical protein